MYEVVGWATAELERHAPHKPRHLLGVGEIDDLIAGVRAGIDTFDCAVPTRLARHGVALVPDPGNRWRVDLTRARHRADPTPILDGCRCPACAPGYSRAYLHHLLRVGELTGRRLLTLHNLAFVAAVITDLRTAIDAGSLDRTAERLLAGETPAALTSCSRRSAA
jgi:queuine tRNA-ribosyltransferase